MAAARMAAETYGMNLPPDPVFIRWNDTPEANQAWYWSLGTENHTRQDVKEGCEKDLPSVVEAVDSAP